MYSAAIVLAPAKAQRMFCTPVGFGDYGTIQVVMERSKVVK
jgi:hypothetical protein